MAEAAGHNTAAGYAGGVRAGTPEAVVATRDVGMSSMDAMQSTLGIHSPSTVFAGYGEMAAAGYAEGMMASRGMVRDATATTVAMPPAGGGAGSTSVTMGGIHISINVEGGGDARATGDAIAERLDEILPEHVAKLFERIQIMRGS